MTISQARRIAIRKFYRTRRVDLDKTQQAVADAARMDMWRYFRIENGRAFPNEDERPRLARVLRVDESSLPTAKDVPDPALSSAREASVS